MSEANDDYGAGVTNLADHKLGRAARPGPSGLHGAGGGGGMDGRVLKLERDVGDIKETLKRLEPALTGLVSNVAEVKGKVSNMPTTWQLIGLVATVMALTFGIIHGPKLLAPADSTPPAVQRPQPPA